MPTNSCTQSARIESEILVVADRVFGLVGFDFSLVLQEDFAAPLHVCVVLV
jgi:hypothetical protein